MFGAAIYFADSKEAARHKSQHGEAIIITADVDMGRALILERPNKEMTPARLNAMGYDSIKGRGSPSAAWEYVVFHFSQVTLISAEGTLPFRPKPQLRSVKQFPPGRGEFIGIIAHLTRQCGGNVDDCQVVKITSSTPHHSDVSGRNAADLASDSRFIGYDPPNWICYDFRERHIVPTHYTLRAYGNIALRCWSIETSLTGGHDDWKRIDRRDGNSDLRWPPNTHTFEISQPEECRYIRLAQTGCNWPEPESGNVWGSGSELFLLAWEIFGSLLE
jgi:hypothetical protein